MLDRVVPVNLFQSVSEFGRAPASVDARRLPASPSTTCDEPKRLSHYRCTRHVGPEPVAHIKFNDIFQEISSLLENNNVACLFAYLERDDIYKAVQDFATKEKERLAQLLYKDGSYRHARSALATDAGYQLALLPTSDQYMVASICSLLETGCCQQSATLLTRRINYHYHPDHVAWLKSRNASHIPRHFIDESADLTMPAESQEYFGLHAGRVTRNFAWPCPVCFVHTTDEQAHARLFHPDGLARVGRNEAPSRFVFSEQFLQLLDSSHLPEQVKEHLFPPVLHRLFDKVGCNYAALPHSAQLLPEAFLSDEMRLSLDQSSEEYIALMKLYTEQALAPENAGSTEAIVSCIKTLVNCATNIPTLALMGAEIKTILQQRQVAIPRGTVAERFPVKKFPMPIISLDHANAKLRDTTASLLAVNIATQQTQWYLAGRGGGEDFFSRTAIHSIVRLAMDAVSARNGSDVRPGSSPVFIGYVPPEVANGIAAKHGFLDCIHGGNVLHGKYSHALAITCLAYQSGLTQKVLATIINSSLWGKIFDQNPHGAVDAESRSSNLPFIELNRTKSLMFNNSPYKLHALLTTGQFSASLEEIATVISHSCQQDYLLHRFACRMGLSKPLTLDKLAHLTDDIRVLEMVLATKHLNAMEQMNRARGDHSEALHDPGAIHGYLSDETPSIGNCPNTNGELERKKARKYLAKNCQVLGIELADNSAVRTIARAIEITTEDEIDQFKVFVVYPPDVQSEP